MMIITIIQFVDDNSNFKERYMGIKCVQTNLHIIKENTETVKKRDIIIITNQIHHNRLHRYH